MATVLLMFVLCCLSVVCQSEGVTVPPDTVHTLGNPVFIYHQYKNLMLTTTDTACYYLYLTNYTHNQLNTDAHYQTQLELQVMTALLTHSGLRDSNLTMVRDQFGDMLADFHCLNKTIFFVEHSTVATTISTATTIAATTTTATTIAATTTTASTIAATTTTTTTTAASTTTTVGSTNAMHSTTDVTTTVLPTQYLHDCHEIHHGSVYDLKADVAFLLDISHGNGDFQLVKDFLDDFVTHYVLSKHALEVSVTLYDDQPYIEFFLFDPRNNSYVVTNAINSLQHQQLHGYHGTAVQYIHDYVFNQFYGDREDAANVLVVLTDGPTLHHDITAGASTLHADNVEVVVIGVGNNAETHHADLGLLATSERNNLHVDNYGQLDRSLLLQLMRIICTKVHA